MKPQTLQNIILLVIALMMAFLVVDSKFEFKGNRSAIEHSRDSELHYWKAVSDLTDEVQKYINEKSPNSNLHAYNLIDKCWEYEIDIKFVLAQAQIESNFGTSGLAAKTNSVWNVGAFDNMTYDQVIKKYKYKHPNESIEPYIRLLSKRYLVGKSEVDLMQDFTDLVGNRYATETTYEQRLKSVYDNITLTTNIDSLQSLVRHYKVESGR